MKKRYGQTGNVFSQSWNLLKVRTILGSDGGARVFATISHINGAEFRAKYAPTVARDVSIFTDQIRCRRFRVWHFDRGTLLRNRCVRRRSPNLALRFCYAQGNTLARNAFIETHHESGSAE